MVAHTYRVLVADDDEQFRQTVCAVFEPYYELIEARTGAEALQVAERTTFDLAVCDLHMPTVSGLDVLRQLKQWRPQQPGILMTANCTADVRQQAQTMVQAILEKPFTRQQLLQAAAQAVASAYQDFAWPRRFGLLPPSSLPS
jgi:two-component system, NtrC family, response regulator HydG